MAIPEFNNSTGTLSLTFADETTGIEAGKPYLVKVSANTDLSAAAITGVTVSKDATPTETEAVNFVPTLFDDGNRAALSQDIKDLQDQCLETRSESIIAAQRGMMDRPSRIGVLKQLEVPVLFVYGKSDSRIPLEIALSQAMLPHHSEIMLLDGVGHMSFMENREYVKPRLRYFVDTCYD